ncbi:unnamed protein product [Protopolystoma xenopodis]|uniref:Uncharacterized protein n=1 Tax=Protopolystoma xenopodis TaxID=117903 RepID=A0A3S5BRD6_9PLAT|nr:unnamed protein product [Protopolystoma xenopodis]
MHDSSKSAINRKEKRQTVRAANSTEKKRAPEAGLIIGGRRSIGMELFIRYGLGVSLIGKGLVSQVENDASVHTPKSRVPNHCRSLILPYVRHLKEQAVLTRSVSLEHI